MYGAGTAEKAVHSVLPQKARNKCPHCADDAGIARREKLPGLVELVDNQIPPLKQQQQAFAHDWRPAEEPKEENRHM